MVSESNSNDLKQAAIVGGAWGGVSRLVRVVCQLASIIFLSRLLTPEDFGVVATVASLVTVVNLLRELGLAHAIVQQPKIDNDELNCLFKFTCLLGVDFLPPRFSLDLEPVGSSGTVDWFTWHHFMVWPRC